MSQWPSVKAKRLLAALNRIGWTVKRQTGGSHRILSRPGWPDFVFAFHDQDVGSHRQTNRIAPRRFITGWLRFWNQHFQARYE